MCMTHSKKAGLRMARGKFKAAATQALIKVIGAAREYTAADNKIRRIDRLFEQDKEKGGDEAAREALGIGDDGQCA